MSIGLIVSMAFELFYIAFSLSGNSFNYVSITNKEKEKSQALISQGNTCN